MIRISRGYGIQITVFAFASVLGGCDDTVECTMELRMPISVRVLSPEGLPIDGVTATLRSENTCFSLFTLGNCFSSDACFSSDIDASSEANRFHCSEQGEGEYKVSVKSGDLTWTQSIYIEADECHTIENKELLFSLDPSEAD